MFGPYDISLVFVMETLCVYYEVGTKFLLLGACMQEKKFCKLLNSCVF